MALKNYQYNSILREYDLRRYNNHYIEDEKRNHLKEVCPEYFELDAQIIENSIKAAKQAILSSDSNSDVLLKIKEENLILEEKKKALLASQGFPPDYLAPVYTCSKCKDTGFINDTKCTCFKQLVSDMLYSQSNIKEQLKTENFSKFSLKYFDGTYIDESTGKTPQQNMLDICNVCKSFIADFDNPDRKLNNLFFYGNSGLGKTFLSMCIAKELLDSAHTVMYFTAFHLFELLEKGISNSNDDVKDFRSQFEDILDCDLLIIDDLGTEMVNTFTNTRLNLCINERLLNKKATIISTNLSIAEFSACYSERVFSRIASNFELLKFIGDDVRLKKALEKKS